MLLLHKPLFVLPGKNGRHIGLMSPLVSSVMSPFVFRSITIEGMHKFRSKFTEGYSIVKYRTWLN